MRLGVAVLAVGLATGCVVVVGDARATGTTFTVGSATDTHDAHPGDGTCADSGGNCTLRAAIEEADALAGADTIELPSATYVLTLGELEVTSSDGVTVDGEDVANTTIEAGGSNVFLPGQGGSRLLELVAGAKASLSGLELSNGGDNFGGAILNAGQLTIDGAELDSNQASNYGGAIDQTAGSLALTDTAVESNVAHGNFGGGIAVENGTVSITGSAIDGNQAGFAGGGIYSNGTLTLTDTNVDTNSATGANEDAGGIESAGALSITGGSVDGNTTNGTGHGGGIHVGTTATIEGVEIAGNTAGEGGGIYNDGMLTLHDASIDGNHVQAGGNGVAGGIDNESTLTLSDSSVTNNTSDGSGGGLLNDGSASLTNVTLSGNTASSEGGILNLLSLTLVSSTVSDNGPGGLDTSGTTNLTDTIVAKQRSGADCSGTVTSEGHNLASDGTCSLTATGDLEGVDPQLATLADNGGSARTRALQTGSPAIDAGDGTVCPATDERGVARSGICDIGAFEFTPATPPTPTTTTTTTTTAATATATATTQGSADVAIAGSFLPSSAQPSSPVTLALTIGNGGPNTATSVTVSVAVPPGLTVTSAPPGCAATSSGQACLVGTLASGAHTSLSLRLQSPANGGTATVTAAVSGDEPDPAAANNTATIQLGTGCATELTLDAVTVFAECIAGQADGTLLAQGNVHFAGGATIDVPLVIDPAAHALATQGGASGSLSAGGRAVASGPLVVHTQSVTEPTTGLTGVAISGVSHLAVSLSGWPFLDDLASTGGLYLLSGAGGGALVVGRLQLPSWTLTALSDTIAVQVNAQGQRAILSQNGHFDLPQFNLPFTNWKLASLDLKFLDGGDSFSGTSVFQSSYWGRSSIGPIVISHGKLQSFRLFWDARNCGSCSAQDPTITDPNAASVTLADLRYVSASGINLAKIPYTSTKIVTACASLTSASACAPPQIAGTIEGGFYGDKIIADVNFQYFLSGALNADGRVYIIPLWPTNVPAPNWAQGNSGFETAAKKGIAIGTASLQYTPPNRVVVGGTYDVVGDFLVGNVSVGFDPPHFTGEGGFTLKVPDESPVFGGKKIAGVEGLISDKAAAAQADLKVCIEYIGCARTFLGVAYEWNGHWVFGEPVENFRTVSADDGERLPADSTRGPLAIPSGWKLAVVKVQSETGVPNVELTSPRGLIAVSSATSSALGNTTGALVSTSATLHEETFLLALPETGRWQVTELGGPAVTSVELGHGLVRPKVVPQSPLPTHASTSGALRLRWRTENAWPGASVDLWAGTTRGAGGTLIASGLPASGTTTWRPRGLQSGRYFVWAVLNRDGVPGESAFWRRAVDLAAAGAPRPPARVAVRRTHGVVVVSWPRVAQAFTYAVVATPAHGRPLEVDTPATQAVLHLSAGRRYAVIVRSIGRNELRGAATRAIRVRG